MGRVPAGQALLRSGAAPCDELWVSGTLGDAAFGLAVLKGERMEQNIFLSPGDHIVVP